MTMGRPVKPAEQKRRLGNPGKRSLPDVATVVPLPALPAGTPSHLEDAGAKLWADVTSRATAWLAPSDEPVLSLLCELADRREIFREALEEHGALILRPDGHMVANPAALMLSDVEKRMVHIASLLGLTPADRTRIGLGEVKAKNAFEEMLSKRKAREE